jgi:curved DNA-binding protein CbpA
MNFYVVLGVQPDADEETIRGAYRILARRYHPDRGTGSSAEKFRIVNEAYETLIDPGSRHLHDLSLQSGERRVPVRHGPIVVQSKSLPREDAGVFGKFPAVSPSRALRISGDFDELFDRWFDDLFSGPEWP